uniref:Uncharacterized protein n=1 Tax=Cucumis melo TaxID=3656 RepID=A0A9I9CHX2_CUCME
WASADWAGWASAEHWAWRRRNTRTSAAWHPWNRASPASRLRKNRSSTAWRPRKKGKTTSQRRWLGVRGRMGFLQAGVGRLRLRKNRNPLSRRRLCIYGRIENLVSSLPALRLQKYEACSRGRPLAEEWE